MLVLPVMILIADSGSTKCDWLLTNKEGESLGNYKTLGFNPLFQGSETIAEEIKKETTLASLGSSVEAVYYYGAGVNSEEKVRVVRRALMHVFPNAIQHIEHDLAAAAYATYDGRPCISCIIGTGSNSCFFDGKTIVENRPALGFILGDEGSGAYLGKQLIADYLYSVMPDDIAQELAAEYKLTELSIFEAVYQKPRPNVYLAGFVPFIISHSGHPYFRDMVHKAMVHFINVHVLCFENAAQYPVHFVGSVANSFSDIITTALKDVGLTPGTIIKKPIDKLLEYHVKWLF